MFGLGRRLRPSEARIKHRVESFIRARDNFWPLRYWPYGLARAVLTGPRNADRFALYVFFRGNGLAPGHIQELLEYILGQHEADNAAYRHVAALLRLPYETLQDRVYWDIGERRYRRIPFVE